ncbi:MAG: hypothetical protein Q9223_002018 [Gallowayella weberi]
MTPYMIPFLGHTISFVWDAIAFTCSVTKYGNEVVPAQIKLLRSRLFLVQGRKNIQSVWRLSQGSAATPQHNFYLKQIFGMPDKALRLYTADDSGCLDEPRSYSTVKPENRIDHITHKALSRFLSGPGLDPFFDRFTKNMMRNLGSLGIGHEWMRLEDLWALFRSNITSAAIEAMCGSAIMALHPSFADDLWAYDSGIPDLVKGLPRWWVSGSYAKRDHILRSIKSWHAYARKNFDASRIGPDGDWDPIFGSRFIRERQDIFPRMDGMDDDGMAASDLGAIWATNTNAVPAAFWCSLECFSDPSVLQRVRAELSNCTTPAPDGSNDARRHFDIDKLVKNDLLQSIYAESLRLRIAAFIMRSPEREDMKINEWIFPKGEIALVATTPAHMDESVWNTGPRNEHPLHTFWADRFLVYPDDPTSGPTKPAPRKPLVDKKGGESHRPFFTLDGLAGSWIPYGGGFRACPGRTFAKREILMTLAVVVMEFDVEVADEMVLQVDPRQNGLGTHRPKARVPCRIRRRRV